MSLSEQYSKACEQIGITSDAAVVAALQPFTEQEPAPISITIANTTLGPRGCKALSSVLSKVSLDALTVASIYAGCEGSTLLVHSIRAQSANSLTRLDMSGNGIRDISSIAAFIPNAVVLKDLCLDWNKLGMDLPSLGVLCTACKHHPALTTLGLRNNLIGKEGVSFIADLIGCGNQHLETIALSWNNIGEEAIRLYDGLVHNNYLLSLPLDGNNVPRLDFEAIQRKLQTNESQHWQLQAKQKVVDEKDEEMERLQKAEKDLTSQVNEQFNKIELLTEAGSNCKEQLDIVKDALKTSKETLESALAATSKRLEQSEVEAKALRQENEVSNQKHTEQLNAARNEVEEGLAKATQLKRDYQSQKENWEAEQRKMKREISELQDTVEARDEALRFSKDECKKLGDELQERRQAQISSEGKIFQLQEENERLSTEVKNKQMECKTSEQRESDLSRQLREAQSQEASMKQKCDILENNFDEVVQKEIQKMKREMDDMQREFDVRSKGIQEAVQVKDKLIAQLEEDLKAAAARFDGLVKELQSKNDDQTQIIADLQLHNSRLKSECTQSTDSEKRAMQRTQNAEGKVGVLRKELETREAEIEDRIQGAFASSQKEVEQLEAALAKKNQQISNLENENFKFKNIARKMKRESEAKQKSMEEGMMTTIRNALRQQTAATTTPETSASSED